MCNHLHVQYTKEKCGIPMCVCMCTYANKCDIHAVYMRRRGPPLARELKPQPRGYMRTFHKPYPRHHT